LSTQPSSASTAVEPVKCILPESGDIRESSLAAADFDGDGRKEIVAGATDGMLYVVSFSGFSCSVVWSRQTNVDIEAANPPTHAANNNIRSSPAIADLDSDGHLDIVIAVGGDVHDPTLSNHRNGGVLVYRYSSTWNFSLLEPLSPDGSRGWPQPRIDQVGWPPPGYSNADGYWDGIVSTPALGDLDGDGDLEIVVLGIDRRIHAWHHDGTRVDGWPISQWDGDALWRGGLSSPALGDLDDDGLPEVVVGTMSPCQQGQSGQNATLWAINGDSTNVPGFPVCTEQILHSSPALGDIDKDGRLEIVIASGYGTPGRQNLVYAWNHDGTSLPGWPVQAAGASVVMAPPALGDIDNDGEIEIVVGCGNGYQPDSCDKLYAWNPNGTLLPHFPMTPPTRVSGYSSMPYTPVLADIDSDGTVEILMGRLADWALTVVDPSNGTSEVTTHQTAGGLLASPIVDDMDGDGLLETAIGGVDYATGKGAIYIWNETGTSDSLLPWPMFHRNVARTGYYPRPPRLVFPAEIRVFHQYGSGDTEVTYAAIQNAGDGEFEWQMDQGAERVEVIPIVGTVASTSQVQLTITTTGLITGWHSLGTLTVTGSINGEEVLGSPAIAHVYLYVGDVSRVYLPLVLRR